ncbi:MAG: hypothetical protein JSW46_06730, partial [Gemmatimonadota bacterium]
FLKYVSEEEEAQGGLEGAVLHFLMEWGLTADQERELQNQLARVVPGARLRGAAQVEAAGANGTFRVLSGTVATEGRARSLVHSGHAPVFPGSRVVVAADLDRYGAQLLAATLDSTRSISDLSLEVHLVYTTFVPAAQGRLTVDWQRLVQSYDSLGAEYTHRYSEDCFLFWCDEHHTYDYSEIRNIYDFLLDSRVVQLHWDERVDDERLATIRNALFEYFTNLVTEPAEPDFSAPPRDTTGVPEIRRGDRYTFKRITNVEMRQRGVDTHYFSMRLAFKRKFALTGNLLSWYNAVRDNESCVGTIILNDQFYQHRRVEFLVDLSAPQELFSSAINYVTIQMQKERDSGNPFQDYRTISENYIRENGVHASMTYAAADDPDPAGFQYRVQWSLKGGSIYPADPSWQSSDANTITLVPPVEARTIDLEGDLAELAASDITRVTAQVHYRQFGREREENIQLSVARGEPIVSATILMDKEMRGYVYRLVINHKREGKLVLPWSARVGDDYILATIPDNLFTDAGILQQAKDAATTAAEGVMEQVLDRFAEVLGGRLP